MGPCANALELVEHMNWAAKFHSGDGYRPIEVDVITRVDEEGNCSHHIHLISSLEARSRMSAKLSAGKEDDVADTPRPSSEVESMATFAERAERVEDALRFFARGDWINLYKAWEVVGDAANGPTTSFRMVAPAGKLRAVSRVRRRARKSSAMRRVTPVRNI